MSSITSRNKLLLLESSYKRLFKVYRWESFAISYEWYERTITVDEVTNPKPVNRWDNNDYSSSKWNSKAINALFSFVTHEEFCRICMCEVAKDAWDILETIHEGINSFIRLKLQRLTTNFETLIRKDNESFDEFYGKLSDIANSSFTLGEKIHESTILAKILRSLPDHFQSKVIAIEEYQNIGILKLKQLIRNLQTYETNLLSKKKQKDALAFESSH